MIQKRQLSAEDIQIDFRAHTPIVMQITRQLQRLVMAGKLQAGDQLPTVRQLALDLGINFNTVARAYRMLDQAGLISTQQGRGTFILEHTEEVVDKLQHEVLDDLVERMLQEANGLDFEPEEIMRVFQEKLDKKNK